MFVLSYDCLIEIARNATDFGRPSSSAWCLYHSLSFLLVFGPEELRYSQRSLRSKAIGFYGKVSFLIYADAYFDYVIFSCLAYGGLCSAGPGGRYILRLHDPRVKFSPIFIIFRLDNDWSSPLKCHNIYGCNDSPFGSSTNQRLRFHGATQNVWFFYWTSLAGSPIGFIRTRTRAVTFQPNGA